MEGDIKVISHSIMLEMTWFAINQTFCCAHVQNWGLTRLNMWEYHDQSMR